MREPGLHQSVISFASIDRWLLRTPAQCLQPTSQVERMVAHPKRHQKHRTDAQERPPIRVKAGFQRPCFEDCQHALPLLSAQAGRAPRNRACLQAGHLALVLAELSSPRVDGHQTNPPSAGDLCMGELFGLEQPPGFQMLFFPLTTREMSRAPKPSRLL
jgi:hypothetical protein